MAEFGAVRTLGSITFNSDIEVAGVPGCMYLIENVTGEDGTVLRVPIDQRPRTDGAIKYDSLKDARHITVDGWLITGRASQLAQLTARNTMEDNLDTELAAIYNSEGTWTVNRTGMAARSLAVYCDVPVSFPDRVPKKFVFGLVAVDPDWT